MGPFWTAKGRAGKALILPNSGPEDIAYGQVSQL
jgi:hypothetical protein